MKIVIITGSSIRHKAFVNRVKMSKEIQIQKVFYERGDILLKDINENSNNKIQMNHFLSREATEKDFFSWFLEYSEKKFVKEEFIQRGLISENSFLKEINSINPEYIIVYGSSIIKGELIEEYKDRILSKIQYE